MQQDAARADLLRELWNEGVAIGTRLLDIPTILIALALTLVGAGTALVVPADDPWAVAIGGCALLALGVPWSVWRSAIARRHLVAMAELYARHNSVPADPPATRDQPAAILRPDDAADTTHLDRILARKRSDWPEPGPLARRLTFAGWLLAAVMLVSFAIVVAGLVGLAMSTRLLGDDEALAVRGGLALAIVLPAITVSRFAASMRDVALVDEAAQWDRAQVLLDSGTLADDGSDLRMIHRGAKLQVAVRRASYALRPGRRHFAAARQGVVRTQVTGLTPWLILGTLGVAVAIFSAATAG